MANWQRGVMRLMRIANHPVKVTGITDFTPWYRRITFEAPDFVSSIEVFPTLWLRLWVPHPERGKDYVSQRGYTLVDVQQDAGTFSLDFVIHDGGPATTWAQHAHLGEVLEVAVTPAHITLPSETSHVLLAGDVTALPAINSWLADIPEEVSVQVIIEDDHDDTGDLPVQPHVNSVWTWVKPGNERGEQLAASIREKIPTGNHLYAWAAGEKGLVKQLRPVFREELSLEKTRFFTQFYWIEGKAVG